MFVVTGGGSGIGKALAESLATRDYNVLIIGRREELLADVAQFSPKISYLTADVATTYGRELISTHLKPVNKIFGLIHNAGVIEPIMPIEQIEEDSWHNLMATNLDAPLFLTLKLKHKLVDGRVLNISSGAAHFPVIGWAPYCISKAALSMLTRCWQLECKNIAFASVMPGIIDTDMQEIIRSSSSMDPDKIEFFKQLYTEDKLISKETVASFLCWLLLDLSKETYVAKEWDIYDKKDQRDWLKSPFTVPDFE